MCITVTSNECHGASNLRHLDDFFSSMFKLTTKTHQNFALPVTKGWRWEKRLHVMTPSWGTLKFVINECNHYNDVTMGSMASQITNLTIVYSSVYSGADQRKHQSSTGLCAGNSPGTGEFPAQMASDAENVSIWWRHHDHDKLLLPVLRNTMYPAKPWHRFVVFYILVTSSVSIWSKLFIYPYCAMGTRHCPIWTPVK